MSEARRIARLLNRVTEEEARALTLDIHNRVTRDTPVNTGWARANWVPSVGTPQEEPVGSPDRVTTAPANAGVREILAWRFAQGLAFIANNVPYIGDLNAGSSRQAPAGFVQKAIQTVVNRFNRKRLE